MIKPSEFCPANEQEDRDRRQQERIEAYFDRLLMAGRLTMPATRSGWLIPNIEAVLQKYRDAGWKCSHSPTGYVFSRD